MDSHPAVLDGFVITAPKSIYRNTPITVDTSDLHSFEGESIIWSLQKDGVSVEINSYTKGSLTDNGGTLCFNTLGEYILTGTVTTDVGRAFTSSAKIQIINQIPTAPIA